MKLVLHNMPLVRYWSMSSGEYEKIELRSLAFYIGRWYSGSILMLAACTLAASSAKRSITHDDNMFSIKHSVASYSERDYSPRSTRVSEFG